MYSEHSKLQAEKQVLKNGFCQKNTGRIMKVRIPAVELRKQEISFNNSQFLSITLQLRCSHLRSCSQVAMFRTTENAHCTLNTRHN